MAIEDAFNRGEGQVDLDTLARAQCWQAELRRRRHEINRQSGVVAFSAARGSVNNSLYTTEARTRPINGWRR